MSASTTPDEQGFILDPVTDIPVGHKDARDEMSPEEQAEFLTFRLHECDSRKASLEAAMADEIKKSMARIMSYYQPQIDRQERRRRWLLIQYFLPVQEWAQAKLKGAKERSIKLIFGTLQLRTTPARIAVREAIHAKNEYLANSDPFRYPLIAWAMQHQPQSVKITEAFHISKLPKSIAIDALPADLFEEIKAFEKFEIDTGVAKTAETDVVAPVPAAGEEVSE